MFMNSLFSPVSYIAQRRMLWLAVPVALVLGPLTGCMQPVSSQTQSLPQVAHRALKSSIKAVSPVVTVKPKGLNFVQDELHNCGTVAMLLSWATQNPQAAKSLVQRLPHKHYRVRFPGVGPVTVTPNDLKHARKVGLISAPENDPWAAIVLTAFTKLKSPPKRLNFKAIEWIYAGEIGYCLTGGNYGSYDIKPMVTNARGMMQLKPAVTPTMLDQQLRMLRGRPAVAYTNRYIHIWAILDYDARRHRVQVRNPRRSSSVWMPLSEFRQRFQLIVYKS